MKARKKVLLEILVLVLEKIAAYAAARSVTIQASIEASRLDSSPSKEV
jgi:hypothetical protein